MEIRKTLFLLIAILLFTGCVKLDSREFCIKQRVIDTLPRVGTTHLEYDRLIVDSDLTIPIGSNLVLASPNMIFTSTITVPFGSSLTLTGNIAFSGCIVVGGSLTVDAATITSGMQVGNVPEVPFIKSIAATKGECDNAPPILRIDNCVFTRIDTFAIASGYFEKASICNTRIDNSTFRADVFDLNSDLLDVEAVRIEDVLCRGGFLHWLGESSTLTALNVQKCIFYSTNGNISIHLIGKTTMTCCHFANNCGNISLLGGLTSKFSINHSVFLENAVKHAFTVSGGGINILNCLFEGNRCSDAVVYLFGSYAIIQSCLFIDNISLREIARCAIMKQTIYSTIFRNNISGCLINLPKITLIELSDINILSNIAVCIFSVISKKANPGYSLSNVLVSGNRVSRCVAADIAFAKAIFGAHTSWRNNVGDLLLFSCDEPDEPFNAVLKGIMADNPDIRKVYEKDHTREQMELVKER